MKVLFRFHVTIPEADAPFSWIGGGLKPSERAGYVWMTKPGGEPILEVELSRVTPITKERIVELFIEDARRRKAGTN